MARRNTNLVASTSAAGVNLGFVDRRRDNLFFGAMVYAYGTFGSGTATFFWSPDGGTTLIPLNAEINGSAISLTANGYSTVRLYSGAGNTDKISIWAKLIGATSPNVNIGYYDNN